ncbi:GNAT family N-acetyltransferase [Arvimicrobium flavum]|uniref:GNAT family N-acetyltransferase n=1 Tax=Arvimicrobium flavum TaxID=3393320 RepID=UPI00237A1D68|nr:GNAT family N-acetyltransferase [Mesorhizobium shangrilense]
MASQLAQPELASVRRFEAAGFRAWPAANVHYDGTWLTRLTPAHPARRLNSVNPLDPGDVHHLEDRIERAGREFAAVGRTLTFRMSPLSGDAMSVHFDRAGWHWLAESLVMHRPLDDRLIGGAIDQIPMKDVPRFVGAAIKAQGASNILRPALTDILTAIQPEAGLFALEREDDEPLATAICVQDGDLAGLFEIATAEAERGKGYARRIVLSALKWARLRGARIAWLQVEASNERARSLYASLGFTELYRYHYRQPAET